MVKAYLPLLLLVLNAMFTTAVHAQKPRITRLAPTATTSKDHARYLPPGDPNLDPNWDWRTLSTALPNPNGHLTYYKPAIGPIVQDYTQVPFHTNGHPLADAVTNAAKDMQPADGWMLVYRDFGTAQAAPELPFFVLYNKYRGILRVMVKNQYGFAYSAYKMSLSFRSSSPREALMTFTSNNNTTLDNHNGSNPGDGFQVDSFFGNTTQLGGWFYGDFVLFGYDPTLDVNAVMNIRLAGINKSSIVLNSTEFTLDEVLSGNSPGGSSDGGRSFGNAKFFSSFESLRKAAEKSGIKRLVDAANSKFATSFVPFLGATLGLVDFFIGGESKASPREPMQFKGVLNMTGVIESNLPVWSKDFALSMNKTDDPELYRPVQSIPWGVFNINNRPEFVKIIDERTVQHYFPTDSYYDDFREVYALAQPITYSLNPALDIDLISVEATSDLTTTFWPLADFNTHTYEVSGSYHPELAYRTGEVPTNVFVKLTFRIRGSVINSDQTIVVFKDLGLSNPSSSNRTAPTGTPTTKGKAAMTLKDQRLARPLTVGVSPNPAEGAVRIVVSNPATGPVHVRVRNMYGQEVWQQASTAAAAGSMYFIWDSNGLNGAKLPAGPYIIEATSGAQRKTHRILIR